jgi:hypothetical protein
VTYCEAKSQIRSLSFITACAPLSPASSSRSSLKARAHAIDAASWRQASSVCLSGELAVEDAAFHAALGVHDPQRDRPAVGNLDADLDGGLPNVVG